MAFLLSIDLVSGSSTQRRIDLVWVIAKSFTLGPCSFPVIDKEPLRLEAEAKSHLFRYTGMNL